MKATETTISSFLQQPNVQFVIPVYQRNYDWTHSECRQLFQDILSVAQEQRTSHFIGSIVYIHEGPIVFGDINELVIIDGQQRLTTLTLLYVALYRFAKEFKDGATAERIFNMSLVNQYARKEEGKRKLRQNDVNAAAYLAVLNESEHTFEPYSNVKENFLFFRNLITETNFEQIENGLNRLIFVSVSLERGKDDPQRIFESLNSTGLELSQSDLIRNYILMDLPPEEQRTIYTTIWQPIEQNARDLVKQQSLVSDYIRDYLTLRNKKIPNKNKVYQEFKDLYPDKRDPAFIEELRHIKAYSEHYRKLVNPGKMAKKEDIDRKIRRELLYIQQLEINVAFPFLLQVMEDVEQTDLNKQDLLQILHLIQSYVWRRFLVGLPTNALNKIFMTLHSEVDPEDYVDSIARALLSKKGSGKFPSDEEVKLALRDKDVYNTQAKNRRYLFERLENYTQTELVDVTSESITIEHIFPQHPAQEWFSELSDEEIFLFREKYLNTVGNLTLSGNNGALGNRSFAEKKTLRDEDRELGYEYSPLWLNSYLRKIDHWNITEFENRLEIITNRFLKVWPFPQVEIPVESDGEELNLFDAEPPTFRKLAYFIFEDTRVEEVHFARMYFYVLSKLYEKNSQLLVAGQQILKIAREASDFRSAQEVANGWYVESNIDSNTKYVVLKKLLTLYEMEDELMVKYQPADGVERGRGSGSNQRKNFLKDYWAQLFPALEGASLFKNTTPSKGNWVSAGAGISGISFTMVTYKAHVRVELSIASADKDTNKRYYRKLLQYKAEIENLFGDSLEWEELPDKKMSRIKYQRSDLNMISEADWPGINDFFNDVMPRFEQAFRGYVVRVK
ncbi:MAG: DUF4268 domain-containing protein [Cyclobacteriaceae bacterium]|nr:DUF4268 domain-containing protein [Cyclobacteriaceae bacterium]